jgi:hypothetical protein
LFALTPVWAGALLSMLITENTSWWDALKLNTSRGDLFLLSTAAISPIVLYVTVRRGNLPRPFTLHFPGGWFYIICVLFMFGASIILFSVNRLSDTGVTQLHTDATLIQLSSSVIYVISLVLAFVVTATKVRVDATSADVFRDGAAEFTKAWLERDR